ncbi:MAG: hypothetical protein WCH39_07995 [Schlesneria sp.]
MHLVPVWCCLMAMDFIEAFAQDRAITPLVCETGPTESYGLPGPLTSAYIAEFDRAAVCCTAVDSRGYPDSREFEPYSTGLQSGQNSSFQPRKTGTGLDSLPSFRGIKGIKNLPGGVGTLLMANPHIGMTWYPEQNTDQSGTTLAMERAYFQGAVPLYSTGAETFMLTAHVDTTLIQTKAILPTTMQTFPTQLFNVALGVNYFHSYENGNVGGIVFDMGTASDKPFQSGRDMLASGTAFLLMPQDEKSAWFIGANASTNSQVLYGIPIPGGGYFYHPSEDFQAIVGFPFSVVSWKPARDWQLQYVWAFLTTMHARAVYQPTAAWQLYAGFDWTNENWRLAERVNERDHFFYYEKKLATGFLWWFKPNVGLEIAGGWAFDRYFTEVHGFKLMGDNTVNIGSGPYLSSQIDIRF